MNKLRNVTALLLLCAAVFFTSCGGDIEPYEGTVPDTNVNAPVTPANPSNGPVLTTVTYSNVNTTSAASGGVISSDSGSPVSARGVVWSASQNPTISNSKTIDGAGIGSFTSSITGLVGNTTYYVRAYATNANGTSYGNQISFATTTTTTSPSALMAANVNGTQYNHMGPFTYPAFVNKQTSVVTFSNGSNANYIKLQGGNDTDFSFGIGDLEINIFIPESEWHLGTFALNTDAQDPRDGMNSFVNLIYFQNNVTSLHEIAGTITITEFNRTTRKIKGTFSFQYENEMSGSGAIQGPFNVSNGTFDYNLDATFFD